MLILRGSQHPVDALVFSPDAARLYAVHGNAGVAVWNLADQSVAPLRTSANEAVCGEFALHPSGRWAFGRTPATPSPAFAYNASRLIDLQTGQAPYFNFYGWQNQNLAVPPVGDRFFTISYSQYDPNPPATPCKRLYGWTMTPGGPEYIWHRDIPMNEDAKAIVPLDESRFATADVIAPGGYVNNSLVWRIAITIRSAADGAPVAQIPFPEKQIQQLLAAPDGRHLVGRLGTALWAWNASDPSRPPIRVEGKPNKHWMTSLAAVFHPSGRHLLLAIDGKSVIAFDTNTWQQARRWNWREKSLLRTVGVSPDGALAAASGPSGTIVVWDWDL